MYKNHDNYRPHRFEFIIQTAQLDMKLIELTINGNVGSPQGVRYDRAGVCNMASLLLLGVCYHKDTSQPYCLAYNAISTGWETICGEDGCH